MQARIDRLERDLRALRAAVDPFSETLEPAVPEVPAVLLPAPERSEKDCDLVLEHFPAEDIVEARVQGRVLMRVPREQHALGATLNRYRQLRGHGPLHVGVAGDVGEGIFADGWHHQSPRTVAGDVNVTLHGMNDTAAALIGWGDTYGRVHRLEASRLRLYGGPDSFAIRANEPAGNIVLNACAFDAGPGGSGKPGEAPYGGRASFIHWDNIEGLLIKDCTSIGLCTESWVYGKSIRSNGLFILGNHFEGANRNVIHIRPEQDLQLVPDGPVVIKGNRFPNHGHAFGPADGGQAIGVWASPKHLVVIEDNDCRNSRYGAILVSGDQEFASRLFTGFDWQIKQAIVRRNNVSDAARFGFKAENVGELWTDRRPTLGSLYGPTYGVGVIRRTV
jgi:hypothetical protein